MKSTLLAFLVVVVGGVAAPAATQQNPAAPKRSPPKLEYAMRCVLDGAPDRLEVDLDVTGLDPANRDFAFELPNWGEWLDLDEYYVTRVHGTPPIRHDLDNRFYWRATLPEKWDGRLSIHYEIPIVALQSVAHDHHGLLPWRMPTYVIAFSANTLMRLLIGGDYQDADRHLRLVASDGFSIVTGWGGVSESTQEIALPTGADNTVLAFGRPVAARGADGAGGRIDVVQFGAHADRSAALLEFAQRLRAAYASTTGAATPSRELLVVTEPGLGGVHVEGAIVHGHPEVEADGRFGVGTAHFLAHEMFHAWLPGVLKPAPSQGDGGLEWIFEGFTDYLSLWHLAQTGAISRKGFADQLLLLESIGRRSPMWSKAAFADRKVNWREPDCETVAYRGGALLAFHMDVELRDHGEPGLPQLLRDLLRENGGRYDLAGLRKWCEANGLEELWRDQVAGTKRPDVAPVPDDDAFFRFEPDAR